MPLLRFLIRVERDKQSRSLLVDRGRAVVRIAIYVLSQGFSTAELSGCFSSSSSSSFSYSTAQLSKSAAND